MFSQIVKFNTQGYDGFIDFIKAYAILCVLLGHSILPTDLCGYALWAGMQVPLFILVQVFHFMKKDSTVISTRRIFYRIVVPFVLCQIFTCLLGYLTTPPLV